MTDFDRYTPKFVGNQSDDINERIRAYRQPVAAPLLPKQARPGLGPAAQRPIPPTPGKQKSFVEHGPFVMKTKEFAERDARLKEKRKSLQIIQAGELSYDLYGHDNGLRRLLPESVRKASNEDDDEIYASIDRPLDIEHDDLNTFWKSFSSGLKYNPTADQQIMQPTTFESSTTSGIETDFEPPSNRSFGAPEGGFRLESHKKWSTSVDSLLEDIEETTRQANPVKDPSKVSVFQSFDGEDFSAYLADDEDISLERERARLLRRKRDARQNPQNKSFRSKHDREPPSEYRIFDTTQPLAPAAAPASTMGRTSSGSNAPGRYKKKSKYGLYNDTIRTTRSVPTVRNFNYNQSKIGNDDVRGDIVIGSGPSGTTNNKRHKNKDRSFDQTHRSVPNGQEKRNGGLFDIFYRKDKRSSSYQSEFDLSQLHRDLDRVKPDFERKKRDFESTRKDQLFSTDDDPDPRQRKSVFALFASTLRGKSKSVGVAAAHDNNSVTNPLARR